MSFKLLPTREILLAHLRDVMSLFAKVQKLPLPTGVAGKRIVRGYRSEMDEKRKRWLEENVVQRMKYEKYQMKLWQENALKLVAESLDSKIEQWKQWVESRGQLTELEQLRFKKELEQMQAERDWDLRNAKRRAEQFTERYLEKKKKAHRNDLMARMGFFVYRFKYVMDTYGGQIFRGTAICSMKTPRGWKTYQKFVAPT